MRISGHTFIISGGSSGLGLATATILLEQNANVAIFDLNPPLDQLSSDSSRAQFSSVDVSSSGSISSALDKTVSWILETHKPLAGVVCCAGIGSAERALPRQLEGADPRKPNSMGMKLFDRVLNINLRGTVDLIQQTLPHMALNESEGEDGERGVVIIVSSVAAYEGQVGQLAYSASKGAVASLVLPLAREVGQSAGIRVMGIAPGVFETGMTKPPKSKKPAEVKPSASSSKTPGREVTKKQQGGAGSRAGFNPNMIEYPTRMGKGYEFARLVKEIVENPMLNGQVLRLDGAVRMPSRL